MRFLLLTTLAAIIGAFVVAVAPIFVTPASAKFGLYFTPTANFINDSDAPVKIQIVKYTGIFNEQSCLDPGNSDTFHFIQRVDYVSFFFDAGDRCRNAAGKAGLGYSFPEYESEVTYTIRGQKGHYSVSTSERHQ